MINYREKNLHPKNKSKGDNLGKDQKKKDKYKTLIFQKCTCIPGRFKNNILCWEKTEQA